MYKQHPLIGITAFREVPVADGHSDRYVLRQRYVQALAVLGAAPIIVPLLEDEGALRAIYDALDGLLLPGGTDVAPGQYGEMPHPALGTVDEELDRVELTLVRWALTDGLPILGICRGIQLLNVAAGGSLYQDVQTQRPGTLVHRWLNGEPRDLRKHGFVAVPGSQLAGIVGASPWQVNSLHHQAVKRVAPGLVVSAAAPDGVVEGLELDQPEDRFVVAVQFHPEDLYDTEPRAAALFRAFVDAAGT